MIIDAKRLSSLKNLKIISKKVAEGFLYGVHKSPYSGINIEFTEYRNYVPGDSLKNIDWKLWAKTDKYFVKKYKEETNINVWFLLDVSESMKYKGKGAFSKSDYAKMLVAAMSYIFLKQKDAVGLIEFSDKLGAVLKPSVKEVQFSRILKALENVKSKGKTDFVRVIKNVENYVKKRALTVIISDFLDNKENIKNIISYFRAKKNMTVVLRIYDEFEKTLPFTESVLVDMETGESLKIDPEKIRDYYVKEYDNFFDDIKKICFRNDTVYVEASTEDDPVAVIGKIIGKK
jgi:uncharacterized protein (DUF58 family)